jgi:hypothetical protein
MANDVEVLILGWRLKVLGDGVELSVRGPGRARRKPATSMLELAFAYSV